MNDECLGEPLIKDIAVIECEIPRRLLRENEPFVVTLGLPTAACPKDLSGIDDDRLLAFALHRISVLAIRAPDV